MEATGVPLEYLTPQRHAGEDASDVLDHQSARAACHYQRKSWSWSACGIDDPRRFQIAGWKGNVCGLRVGTPACLASACKSCKQ